jgi:hypothetical protein
MSTENARFEDRGPAVFAVTTATLVLATTFVVARLISRKFIVRNITLDDQIIVIAWIFAFGLSFTIDLGTRKGLGRRDGDIEERNWAALRRCQYAFSVLYVSFVKSLGRHPGETRRLLVDSHLTVCRTLRSWRRRRASSSSTFG